MKLLAIILVLISLTKLYVSQTSDSVNLTELTDMPTFIDPSKLVYYAKCVIVGDGLIGLFCALFILFG